MKDPSEKQTSVNQGQQVRILLAAGWTLILLAALPELSRPSPLISAVAQAAKDSKKSSVNRPVEPVELLRQALANFKARGSRAKDYVYQIHYKSQFVDVRVSNNWEIMAVDGQPYRRHLGVNGLPLSPEQEQDYEARLQKLFEETARISAPGDDDVVPEISKMTPTKTLSEAEIEDEESYARFKKELAFDAEEMRNGGSLLVYIGDSGMDVRHLQLPLQRVPDDFEVRLKGHELLDERNTYIIEAKPRREQKAPTGDAEDATNFKLTIWIDELETEIIKVEGKAIHSGLVSRSERIPIHYVNPSAERQGQLRNSLPEDTVSYAAGTTIRMEWRKINDEAWLPAEVQYKTKEIHAFPVHLGKDVQFHSTGIPWEYRIEFSDYKKFDVKTRILPPH